MRIDAKVVLRDRNQLTLPKRIADALGVRAGDVLLLTFDETRPDIADLRLLPRSYRGITGNLYGRNAEERAEYIRNERASWEREETTLG